MENIDKLVQLITDRLLENLQIQAAQSSKGKVYLLGEQADWRNLLQERQYELVSQVSEADWILITSLSIDSFMRLASLCPVGQDESDILTALLAGKKVILLEEALSLEVFKKSASSILYRDLIQQKKKLKNYGLFSCSSDKVFDLLGQGDKQKHEILFDEKKSSYSLKKKLITEEKLKAMHLSEGDSFEISKGMIVTALAKDYLRRHKIKIVE